MKSILVVDDMAIFREPIAASLRAAGFDAHGAADGEQALHATRQHRPDLILLDMAMPGMDGLAFLRRLRAEPQIADTRVILLTMASDKSRVLAAKSLGVTDYILKSSFRLEELYQRIGKPRSSAEADASQPNSAAPAPRDIPQLLTREQFLRRVESVFHAKTLSGVVAEVIALAGSPRGDTTQLATLISRDPMLAARVLQMANSALYASRGAAITTIPDAIRKVGFAAVRNIGAALGVFDHMPEASADGFNPIRYWQHSFAVAQISERLCGQKNREQCGLAYVVGLCHDLGEMFMRTEFATEYDLLAQLAMQTGQPAEQLYGQMLGVSAEQMVDAVLKSMSLPDAIREPIELLHSPGPMQSKPPLAQILWMAENYANGAMLASGPGSQIAPFTTALCRCATGEANPPRPDPKGLRAEVLALTAALARLSPAEEAKLRAPIFQPQRRKLWIARESGVCEFDPLELACESLAQSTAQRRLPAEVELDGLDGLVVVAASLEGHSAFRAAVDALVEKSGKSGRALPVLCVACAEDDRQAQCGNDTPWRTWVTLKQLAEFVQSVGKRKAA